MDWEPNWDTLDQALENLGINHGFAAEQLDEFRMYWLDNGSKRTGWNAAFLNHLQRQWPRHLQQLKLLEARQLMTERRTNHLNSLYKEPHTTREVLTDTSWADGINFDNDLKINNCNQKSEHEQFNCYQSKPAYCYEQEQNNSLL